MPLFEYNCEKCSHQFTELRKTSERDEALSCPLCKESGSKRSLSAVAASGSSAVPSGGGGSYSPPSGGFS